MATHYNIVGRYLAAHPDWVHDQIPLCDQTGWDGRRDRASIDMERVDCPDCIAELKIEADELMARQIDLGRRCPVCHRYQEAHLTTALGIDMFRCEFCSAEWFDSVTQPCAKEPAP